MRVRIAESLAARVSPERTRRATLLERLTVPRLPWDLVVRCNRYLELGRQADDRDLGGLPRLARARLRLATGRQGGAELRPAGRGRLRARRPAADADVPG